VIKNKKGEDYIAIKASIPSLLKLHFKVLCTQQENTMSKKIEELVREWIQADSPTSDFVATPSNLEYEDVRGYLPKELKIQFKVICAQKQIEMNFVLYNLIKKWKKANISDT
jgi:hypothetical protein